MIKTRGGPAHRRVTLRAGVAEISGDVVWVVHLFKIVLVTSKARRGCSGKFSIRVTSSTIRFDMRTGQREVRIIMIERGRRPDTCIVAFLARMRELRLRMIRCIIVSCFVA